MLRDLQLSLEAAFGESGVDGSAARRVLAELIPMGGVSGERGVELYQRSCRAAIGQALSEIFPVCAELVGEDCFRTIVRLYARDHVSRHADLGRVGEALPQRIERLDFLATVPYLADMARLELAAHRALQAPEALPISDPEVIAEALGECPDHWRFVAIPSATLIDSEHAVRAIWLAHRADARDEAALAVIDRPAEPERTIVWRSSEGLRVDAVEPPLWPILRRIMAGESVSRLLDVDDCCDPSAGAGSDGPLEAIALLFARRWIVGAARIEDVREGVGSNG